jgi:hypothetical protein
MGNSGVSTATISEAKSLGLAIEPVSWTACVSTISRAAQAFAAELGVAAQSAVVNKLGVWIQAAGGTPGAGVNGLAIYSAAGVLLAQTGDMTAGFETANSYQEGTLGSSVQVVAGTKYYLAMLTNLTSPLPFVAGVLFQGAMPAVRGNNPSVFITGQASFPASFNPATATPNSGAFFLTAGN